MVIYAVDGSLRFRAFVLTQDITEAGFRRLDYLAEFQTYQVDLADLEQRTTLSLANLRTVVDDRQLRKARLENPIHVTDVTGIAW